MSRDFFKVLAKSYLSYVMNDNWVKDEESFYRLIACVHHLRWENSMWAQIDVRNWFCALCAFHYLFWNGYTRYLYGTLYIIHYWRMTVYIFKKWKWFFTLSRGSQYTFCFISLVSLALGDRDKVWMFSIDPEKQKKKWLNKTSFARKKKFETFTQIGEKCWRRFFKDVKNWKGLTASKGLHIQ